MAVFEYRGILSTTGKHVRGVRDADNNRTLRAVLKREGVLLTSAREDKRARAGALAGSAGAGSFFRRVSMADVSMMTRQLATLVGAGIPLVEAVGALIEQMDKLELKRVLTQIVDRLNEGSSLAHALEAHPKVFPKLYVSMVAAGEASGTLEAVLERLADYLESQSKLRGKVGAALAYPALMMVIGSALITVMMVVVVPKVTSIFESMDQALPWYTELLIGTSHFIGSVGMYGFILSALTFNLTRTALRDYKESERNRQRIYAGLALGFGALLVVSAFSVDSLGLYALGVAAGVVVGLGASWLQAWLATPEGRLKKDAFLLKVPVLGTLLRMLAVSRFARTLATLLRSGVPLLNAMEIVRNVLDNAKLEKVIETAAGSIREGESIAGPLKRSGDFPPIVTHMIAVGERSGQLEQMLENVSRAYDTQVETRVQALTSLLEPLMIVVMGGGVGFIAFAILMPLIQMNEFMQQ
ncbi:MAG TPA: type II secretion system F family protein [Polyangiaceae bacterium]|nr:type II secretion system F family protein [Polyangiaceae bacterium]